MKLTETFAKNTTINASLCEGSAEMQGILTEDAPAQPLIYMTDRERLVKKRLIKMLRETHHNKYADRLENFIIRLVPHDEHPAPAAISFETGEIYIDDALLEDEATFKQLNMLIRHELAHNLMMHCIRLSKKLPNYDKIAHSHSLHDLLNIIMDDEISNTRYTPEDKEIVRHLKIAGREAKGLVTEDHRDDWKTMTLEEMADALEAEIEEDNQDLIDFGQIKRNRMPDNQPLNAWNPTKEAILAAFNAYQGIDDEAALFNKDLKAIIDGGYKVDTPAGPQELADDYKVIIDKVYHNLYNSSYTDSDLDNMLKQIANSKILQSVTLFNGSEAGALTVFTPEEKYIAEEAIKKFWSDKKATYLRVKNFLQSINPDIDKVKEAQAVLDALKNMNKDAD